MLPRKVLLSAVLLLTALPPTASFGTNLLTNGSFETGTFTWDGNDADALVPPSTVIAGWTVTSSQLAVIGPTNHFGITNHDGDNSLDLTGYDDSAPYGGVSQNLPTNPGAHYALTFWVGSASVGTTTQVSASAAGSSVTGTSSPPVNGKVFWAESTLHFTATSSTTAVSLLGLTPSNGGNYIGLDDVSLQLASLAGDANNDGVINADDFALVDRGAALHLAGWSNGDFNGDGAVDSSDYQIIDTAYAQSSHESLIAAVPEPAAPLACLIAGFLISRRRQTKEAPHLHAGLRSLV